MCPLQTRLTSRLPEAAAGWLAAAQERIQGEGPGAVPVLFPQLPRRVGRDLLGGGPCRLGDEVLVDLDRWRLCDAAALLLLARPAAPDALEVDLFMHGDLEERTMVLRSLGTAPVTAATIELLGEAQRTNTVSHFEAAICDSNLAARARASGPLTEDDFNRLVLKLAFSDLELARMFEAEQHANPELSRMLQGLATEREAAGRAVWADTNRMIARAPTDGTMARLIGHLEHGDDRHRLAAAEGLATSLVEPSITGLIEERLAREPREDIREALGRALQARRR